ncbi:MAG: tRNA (guanosine(37)-N1)-methyltransferase TrmD [Actinobacteria bacterium]|nr:MAG: tRNA (guanosine(37)-N1)-methyltransferase TrmD [Actinomycetota bacterium]
MRIDVLSIFPDYLAPLRLSLIGKAIERGQVLLGVHDLRDHAHDRHRTVDDAPYGGGPGMVMSPQPWGEALDGVLSEGSVVVIPTPSGETFTQTLAEELASRDHLVFACGRYEGIDARVAAHYATSHEVREISIGDYVLAGGEAATLVMCEAIVRLLPGVLGNPQSAVDDSFSRPDALLEGPVFTRPPVWRGLSVPDVLLSGDHARVQAWRDEQARTRTRRFRAED